MTEIEAGLWIQAFLSKTEFETLVLYGALYRVIEESTAVIETALRTGTKQAYNKAREEVLSKVAYHLHSAKELMLQDGYKAAGFSYSTMRNQFIRGSKQVLAVEFDKINPRVLNEITSTSAPVILQDLALFPGEEINNLNLSVRNKFKQQLSLGFLENQSTPEIVSNLRRVTDLSRNHADALVKTYVSEVSERAQNQVFKSYQDYISGWIWLSVLDSRTTLGCASLNGKIRKKRSDFPAIPRHIRCRSVVSTLTDWFDPNDPMTRPFVLWDERKVNHRDGSHSTKFTLPKDSSRVGNTKLKPVTSGKTSQSDQWLRSQDQRNPDLVRKYLGPERYRIWHQDKSLAISDLLDNDLNPIPLNQLNPLP